MGNNVLKPWRCPQGHMLGQVVRNGSKITQLLLYRHPIDPKAEAPADVDVMATVEGLVLDVACEICGQIRTWAPSEGALERMVQHFQGPA